MMGGRSWGERADVETRCLMVPKPTNDTTTMNKKNKIYPKKYATFYNVFLLCVV